MTLVYNPPDLHLDITGVQSAPLNVFNDQIMVISEREAPISFKCRVAGIHWIIAETWPPRS